MGEANRTDVSRKAMRMAAEAARLTELSLMYYAPDLEAMAAGTRPLHDSANLPFIRGLYELWLASRQFLKTHPDTQSYLDERVLEVRVLDILWTLSEGKTQEERREVIARKFGELKSSLDATVKREETCLGLFRSQPQAWSEKTTAALPLVGRILIDDPGLQERTKKETERKNEREAAFWSSRTAGRKQPCHEHSKLYYADPVTGGALSY